MLSRLSMKLARWMETEEMEQPVKRGIQVGETEDHKESYDKEKKEQV